MKVEVDREKCVGAGQCVMTADEVFDQRDDDGLVQVLDPTPPSSLADVTRQAATLCPSSAIQVTED